MSLLNIFAEGERSFARDFIKAGFAIVFLATVGANALAFALGAVEAPAGTISVVAATTNNTSRSYTEVRSVLDDDIVTGSSKSQFDRMKIDPCRGR